MIGRLRRVLGEDELSQLGRLLVLVSTYAVGQGVCIVLLVPVLQRLLRDQPGAAVPWLGLLAAAVAVTSLASLLQRRAGFATGVALSRGLHRRIGDHVASLPLGWFDGPQTGRLARLASTGVADVQGLTAHLLAPAVVGVLTPATVVLGMLAVDWRVGLTALLVVPLLVACNRWTARAVQRTDHDVDSAGAEAAGRVVEFVLAQPVIRAYAAEESASRLDEALLRSHLASLRQLRGAIPGFVAFAVAVQAFVTVVTVVGVTLTVAVDLDVAVLVALLVLAFRFAEPLVAVADLSGAIRVADNSLQRIIDLLDTPTLPEPQRALEPVTHAVEDTSVELEDVHFSYQPGTPVLRGISLRLRPGTVTAVVGPSGSGKTTLTRLIARFADVDSGVVRVGGHDVRDLTTEQLMGRLSMVFQDVYLFSGTVRDNIRLGNPSADDEQVLAAARIARLDEVVRRLPEGWDTQVGEGGSRLSGGERQRLSVARALLKDAPIILLDEATSALDPENEAAVSNGIRALAADRTVLVIAHRLQTVLSADQILVLDGGRVVEQGRHEQLLALGGRYADFWAARTAAAGWRLQPVAPASKEDG